MPGSSEALAQAADNRPGLRVVVQLARLGDFLQTTPLLACLRRAYPEDRLALAVTPAQAPLARHCELADELMVLDPATLLALSDQDNGPAVVRRAVLGDLLEPLWRAQPAEVINLNLSKLSALVAAGWPGGHRVGWRLSPQGKLKGEPWSGFVTAMVADRRLTRLHLSDILASYVDPPRPAARRLVYRVREVERLEAERLAPPGEGPVVVLQLGANNDLRRWPVASFAALASGLLSLGARVALVGSTAERPLAQRLQEAMGPAGEAVADLLGRTSLEDLAALLSLADLVVSNDTGTLHLATAVGARTLSLFMGPAQAHETGPYAVGHLVLQARDDCGPCWEESPSCKGQAPCRRLIEPSAVLRAVEALLGGRDAPGVAAGLDLPVTVEALAAAPDDFGLHYRLLRPRPLTSADALALALREAGRVLLRSAYRPALAELAAETAEDFAPPSPPEKERMGAAARAVEALKRPAEARQVLEQWPGLRPLTLAQAGQNGHGLELAVEAALGVLRALA